MAPTFLRARREAQALIKKYHITRPEQIDLDAIAALNNVFVLVDNLPGAEARLQLHNNHGLVTLHNDIPEQGRRRFALAHEIGHYILHRKQRTSRQCGQAEFLQWYAQCSEEPEANIFAAELLMPETMFAPRCQGAMPSFESIDRLKDEFSTSRTSTAFRYVEVGNYPCVLIASQDGKIHWFTASADFGHRIRSSGQAVHPHTAAGEYFETGTLSQDQPETINPLCWLETHQMEDNERLWESTVSLGRYDTTLTLIWTS